MAPRRTLQLRVTMVSVLHMVTPAWESKALVKKVFSIMRPRYRTSTTGSQSGRFLNLAGEAFSSTRMSVFSAKHAMLCASLHSCLSHGPGVCTCKECIVPIPVVVLRDDGSAKQSTA